MSEFHGHLTEEQLHILRTADLAAPECRGMMEHIASCGFCAGRFAVYWKKIRRRRLLI